MPKQNSELEAKKELLQLMEWKLWNTNMTAFIEDAVWTRDEADAGRIKRFPKLGYLERIDYLAQNEKILIIPKSRRMMMTWRSLAIIFWCGLFRSNQTIFVQSKKGSDSAYLLGEDRLMFMYRHLPHERHDFPTVVRAIRDNEGRGYSLVTFSNGTSYFAVAEGADQLRQYTASQVYCTEMAFWAQAELTWMALRPVIQGGGRILIDSSANPGFFARLVEGNINENLDDATNALIAGQKQEIEIHEEIEGMHEYRRNGAYIARVHYTADPMKRDPAWIASEKQGSTAAGWEREMEINFNVSVEKPYYNEFKYDIHVAKQPLRAIEGRPILRGWDYGLCYDDQTEVLTKDGWKFFKDVDETKDIVATKNPVTKDLEYTKINFKVAYPLKDKLIGWKNSTIDFLVTPEHRVPFTYRDSPNVIHFESAAWLAQHMTGHHYVDLTAKWEGRDEGITFGNLTFTAEQFALFMGLYLSEGSCDKGRVCIAQNTDEPYIRNILDSVGIKYCYNISKTKFNGCYRFYNKALCKYLKSFGKAHDKYVPRLIKEATPNVIAKYIEAYTFGDGHVRTRKNGSTEHTIYTVSKRMAGDLQELALKIGIHSSMRYIPPQQSVIKELNKEPRTISGGGGYQITFKKRAKRGELLQRNYYEQDYDGIVYCLNVPYHTLFVRRNGKTCWNGNTPATCFAQTTVKGQLIFLKEVQSINCGMRNHAKVIRSEVATFYPKFDFNDIGDPAGNQRSQADEKTANELLREEFGYEVEPGALSMTERSEAVRWFLTNMTPDGQPMVLLDPSLAILIGGFTGGYHRKQVGDRLLDEPDKNEFSHLMDCFSYICAMVYKEHGNDDRNSRYKAARSKGKIRRAGAM